MSAGLNGVRRSAGLNATIRVTVESRSGQRLDEFSKRITIPLSSLISLDDDGRGFVPVVIRWGDRNYRTSFGPVPASACVEGASAVIPLTLVAQPKSFEETTAAAKVVTFDDGRTAGVSEQPIVKEVY